MSHMTGGIPMKVRSVKTLDEMMRYRRETNRSLALRSGVNRSTIGHLRSGKRSSCGAAAAAAIAKSLEMPIDVLFVPEVATASHASGQRVA